MKLKGLPGAITAARMQNYAVGEYSETYGALRFKKGIEKGEAFATAAHEMTHYADYKSGRDYADVVKQARKNLGLQVRNKAYRNMAYAVAKDGWESDIELVAYEVERYATNSGNKLTNEIVRLLITRGYTHDTL